MSAVLLVEDNLEFGRSVARELEGVGHAVQLVESATQALDYYFDELGTAGIMLTGLNLRGEMTGIDLIHHVRWKRPETRSLLMGTFTSVEEYRSALDAGAIELLVKPFSSGELRAAINKAAECGAGFHGQVHGLNLVDLLQLYHYGRRVVRVELQFGGGEEGCVDMRDGDIVHAVFADHVGERALQRVLAHESGHVRTVALHGETCTITQRFEQSLMDAVRRNDEKTRATGSAAESPFELDISSELETELDVADTTHALIDRLRAMDGYVSSCLVCSDNGDIIASDGGMELRDGAKLAADVVRCVSQTLSDLDLAAQRRSMLVTTTTQYHVFQPLRLDSPAFLHLVLRREATSAATVQWALSHTLRVCDL